MTWGHNATYEKDGWTSIQVTAVVHVSVGRAEKVTGQNIKQPIQVRFAAHLGNKASVRLNPFLPADEGWKAKQVGMDHSRIDRINEQALQITLGQLMAGWIMFHTGPVCHR